MNQHQLKSFSEPNQDNDDTRTRAETLSAAEVFLMNHTKKLLMIFKHLVVTGLS